MGFSDASILLQMVYKTQYFGPHGYVELRPWARVLYPNSSASDLVDSEPIVSKHACCVGCGCQCQNSVGYHQCAPGTPVDKCKHEIWGVVTPGKQHVCNENARAAIAAAGTSTTIVVIGRERHIRLVPERGLVVALMHQRCGTDLPLRRFQLLRDALGTYRQRLLAVALRLVWRRLAGRGVGCTRLGG